MGRFDEWWTGGVVLRDYGYLHRTAKVCILGIKGHGSDMRYHTVGFHGYKADKPWLRLEYCVSTPWVG